MYKLVRSFLFLFNPEKIHHLTFSLIKIGYKFPLKSWVWIKMFCIKDSRLERDLFGIKFPNPVGLAAGFDKDAKLIDELSCFGFGFIEIGTLTPKAQPGNPKPRLTEDSAIINRMGFNNEGVEEAILRLKKRKSDIIIGGNIGKNKLTLNEHATEDYIISFNALFLYVDYFVVNVSSPNTQGLRDLQEKEPLTNLLNSL
ncbi:MAG: dihydroorotate dehydrogenase (quinone), partial [Flavobacteriales bacterium]